LVGTIKVANNSSLTPFLNICPEKTLLLLYSSQELAVPSEDLFEWTEHSNQAVYRRDVLKTLHKNRLIEYDKENQMVAISPLGIDKVEKELLVR
jgi:hypothetical protein